ncbi:MAG: lamin tail domain-containing protein, partial [Lentisphaerae bacterium]|nr:lamin tail domain-containing protein [Lentisphaerota bacterium]
MSYPPADVAIEEKLRNPGYPAQDQDVRMRCEVTDATPGTPTANRRMTLHYQWVLRQSDRPVAGNWLSTNMVPMGGDLYEGVIPRQRPGYVHYYYACDFDGYYYARDPDGPGEEGEYKENTNPRYWETGATVGHTPAFFGRYEVRRYRSEYGRVELTAAPAQATVQMELVGDEIWQGITLVTGITNLTWTFNGFNRYTNDAPYYWSEPVMWGDNDQGFANPPIGGIAEVAATNSMVAEVDYEGFLMIRFDTVERDYIAKRAVYQNFDQWLASKDFFEASLGLYAVQRIDESFNTWPADGYTVDETKSETFELMTPSSTFDGALITTYGWRAGQARVVRERRPLSAMLQGNQGLLLNRKELSGIGGGWVGNSGDSMTLGMERFTTGLRASINDRNFALYTSGFAFAHGQEITLNMLASQLSPEFPSLSVLFSFQPGYPAESYYELRLTQVDETSGTQTDNRFSAQLYRWKAGVPSAALRTYAAAGKLSVAKALVITVSADVNIQVKIDGTVRLNYTDSTADKLNTGGSVAFLTHDAVPLVNTLVVKDLGTGTTLLNHGTGFASTTGWYLGGTPNGGSGNRWTTSGTALTRPVPTQTVSILSAVRRPGASRPDEEDLVELTQVEIASLQYQSIDIPLHKWYEGFVELRYKAGDVDVVVDNPTVSPWRANSRGPAGGHAEALDIPYSAWTSKAQQHDWLKNEYGWAVLEGMVTDAVGVGVGGQDVHLERTRANPDLDQALVSPVLTNGIGEIEFYASVDGGEAHYAVQRTALGAQDEWVTVRIFTNAVDDLLVKRNVPVRENFTGRIRVLLLPTSDPAARLMLDDATVRDYPPRDDTTWQAYNVLVTDQQDDRLYAGQSAYLNNSVSEDVDGIVNEHQPYIQTPSVGTGIGEISFWYRSWSGTTPTELILKAAPTADTPEEEWVVLTNLVVGAGSDYVYFNNPNIYNLDNHVLRVYGDTNSADRVCIDNILMTEPVRAGYEIQAVRLDPPQPLAGQPVAVEVDIGRFLMNPKEINIYLSYTTGTGVWGTENWWTREDTPGSKRVQLEPVAPGSRTYRSPEGALSALAALPIDAVVQYYVWGTHSEISGPGHTPIFQDESSFEHPAWYAPVNLNTNFAAQGWSPYYFVYSCPPYSVWINEIYPYSTYLPAAGEFIELLGPAQANLGGWRIEALDATSNLVDTCMIAGGFTLTNAYNGWGFFVWGDPGTPNVNQTFDPDIVNNVPANGALNLIRSNGAVEHKVCWSGARTFFEARGYTYAGNKAFLSVQSLSLLGDEPGDSLDDFNWPDSAGGTRTPGNVNNSQFLIDITPEPGGYFLLTSV